MKAMQKHTKKLTLTSEWGDYLYQIAIMSGNKHMWERGKIRETDLNVNLYIGRSKQQVILIHFFHFLILEK